MIGCNPTNPGSPIGIPGGPPCRPISSCIAGNALLAPCLQPTNGGSLALDSKGDSADKLIKGSMALQALMATLHNAGVQVTIQSANLPPGTAANATLTSSTSGTIQVDSANMAAAEATGQDPTQILFHELDHLYYESQPGFFSNMPSSATFSIGGTTYSYNTANIPSGIGWTNSQGEMAWEHMLIHNDLVENFGADDTGAAYEGLAGATNAPPNKNALNSTAAADKSKTGSSSRAVAPPSKTAACASGGSASRSTMSGIVESGVTYVDSGFTDTY